MSLIKLVNLGKLVNLIIFVIPVILVMVVVIVLGKGSKKKCEKVWSFAKPAGGRGQRG